MITEMKIKDTKVLGKIAKKIIKYLILKKNITLILDLKNEASIKE